MLFLLVLGTLVSYASIWVSPASFKIAAGVSMLIPFFLLLNLIVLLLLIYKRSVRALVPVLMLALGYPFFVATFGMNASGAEEARSFSVMSYNVKRFVGAKRNKGAIFRQVSELDADINCFQEFYNRGGYIQKIQAEGDYTVIHDRKLSNLAIASKFPVINHGLLLPNQRFNNIMFADMLLAKEDTLRVYNIHLQSMGITHTNRQYYEDIVSEYDDAKTKFLEGASVRANQITALLEHAEGCSYPILIVGDFNDVPYSYNYFKVRRGFVNAFEKAGSGLGFTYNGDLPFLRIDNQFFNDDLRIHSFTTIDSTDYSDHHAILGIYSISD